MKQLLRGRLMRADLGPGVLVLETADGQRWSLEGRINPGLVGQQVEVEGDEEEGAFGFAMVGPTLQVRQIRAT